MNTKGAGCTFPSALVSDLGSQTRLQVNDPDIDLVNAPCPTLPGSK